MSISAWSYGSPVISPDGEITANIVDVNEVAMGAPTSGTLELSNGFTFENCNPSLVWSEDSKLIAIPVWQNNLMQKLGIIDVINGKLIQLSRLYRILELYSFKEGIVDGVDSPIHNPEKVALNISAIIGKK